MHKKLLTLAALFLVTLCGYAQGVGLGTTRPDTSAALDITAAARGLLIPRMSIAAINAIPKPARGLLAFDTIANQLMVNIGSTARPNWQPVSSNAAGGSTDGWETSGNRGINPASQFIGTTDIKSLRFRVNNRPIGAIDPASGNLFWGLQAGHTGTVGIHTIAIGPGALQTDSTTDELVAIGDSALSKNGKGTENTAIGSKALSSNTQGSSNTAAGAVSLFSNSTGTSNTATGSRSLGSNVTGQFNVADGNLALLVNETAAANVAIGYQTLFNSSTGISNTAIGQGSLFQNETGSSNTATGFHTLFSNTSGSSNTAFGDSALLFNNTGSNNTAIGYSALLNNSTGRSNTAIGDRALIKNTAGTANIAIGEGALFSVTTGALNLAIGRAALVNITSSVENVAVGTNALSQVRTNLFGNTGIGTGAGGEVDMTEDNTAVGAGSVLIQFADNNVCLGAFSQNNFNNDQVNLGNSSTTSIGGAVNFSKLSDGRFKKNIRENVSGIDFIMKLRPVTYQVDMERLEQKLRSSAGKPSQALKGTGPQGPTMDQQLAAGKIVHSGFIAQEVEKAAGETGYDFIGINKPQQEGGLYSLRYASFVVPLVKAVQDQQQTADQLRQGNTDLERQLETLKKIHASRMTQLEDLQKRLLALEKKSTN